MSRVLIDADSMVYIQGWDVKDLPRDFENYPFVINKIDQFVKNILNACAATEYVGFLKGHQPTFRHLADPSYKANRKTGTNEWLNAWDAVIKHRLVDYWGFINVEGMEAEDAVSMMAEYYKADAIVIAHIDKDLNQIPGKHYNYNKLTMYDVTVTEAERHLFKQVLMGDSTDNITGIPGVGPKTAEKILDLDPTQPPKYLALGAFIANYAEREGILKFAETYKKSYKYNVNSLNLYQ